MESLQDLARQTKAPIAAGSIDEKVAVFESRMNGRILPFVGLHGCLLTLVYLLRETDLLTAPAVRDSLLPALVMAGLAALCGLVTALGQAGGKRSLPGGAAFAVGLGMLAILQTPWMPAATAAAVVLYWVLVALNATGRSADYEFNTATLYLPVIFLLSAEISGGAQLAAGLALYAPAIYLKFRHQPHSSKMALGFSLLAYLAITIRDNADTQGLIAAMVAVVLVLFIVYSFRTRHLAGSAYRHFLTDAILAGLWAVLVWTLGLEDWGANLALAGLGIAAYQGIALSLLKRRKAEGMARAAERDARLGWLQIATVLVLADILVDVLLEGLLDSDLVYPAVLIVVLPFVALYRHLRSGFLALTTRLWIGGCLLTAVNETRDLFYWDFLISNIGKAPAEVHGDVLELIAGQLFWLVFALAAGMAATLRARAVREVPWWRGLVPPRPMVHLRRSARLVIANANRIAFVGSIIAALSALFTWLRYAGGDGRGLRSRDLMLLGVHVYAVAITVLFMRYLEGCCDEEAYPALDLALLTFPQYGLPYVLAFCLWGLALYLRGVILRDTLARFFATGFVAMPLVTFTVNNSLGDAVFLAEVALICCFSLFCFGLLRRFAQ